MSTLEELQQQLPLLIDQLTQKGIMTSDEGNVLLDTIRDSDLSQGDLNALILDLSREAGLPVVTDTINKVARWRKIIIGLMLAGITGVELESNIPGIYYSLYEKLSTTVMSLLNAGIPKDQIRDFINNAQMPSMPSMPSMPNMNPLARLSNLKDKVISGFFIASSIILACVNMVCSAGQTIAEQLSIDNLKFTSNLAAQMASPVGITYAIQILKGEYDRSIADFIDTGAIQRALSKADDTVIDVKRSIAAAVAESAINVDDMKLGIKWTNLVPDRRIDADTDRSINNEIERAISDIFSDPNNSAMFSKIEMLNEILEVLRAKDKARAIQQFTAKYRDTGSSRIPILLTLLTAPPAQKSKYGTMSQPDPTTYAMPGADLNMTRSASFMGPYKEEFPGAKTVFHQEKSNLGRFDAATAKEHLIRLGIIPPQINVKKITWDPSTNDLLNVFINIYVASIDPELVDKLNFLSPPDHNEIIMRINEMARENGANGMISSFKDPLNQDNTLKQLGKNFKDMYDSIKIQIETKPTTKKDLSGGRYKKSRHYKRKRMTQRRRMTKRKRTIQKKRMTQRKGKKRRSTKRKR